MTLIDHLIYAALWLVFGFVHSALAGPKMKLRLKSLLGGGYRFAYNLFALVQIALVIYGTRYMLASDIVPFAIVAFVNSCFESDDDNWRDFVCSSVDAI